MPTSNLTAEDLKCLARLGDCPDPFPPPRLSMDEYFELVGEFLQNASPDHLERQHRMKKKHLYVPFRTKE